MLKFKELMERINITKAKMGDVVELEADRGANEEVEDLDELSTATLRNYRNKARDDAFDAYDVDDDRRLRKRSLGANQAGKKIIKRGESLRKEEVEDLDEGSYKDNPRHMGTIGPITTDAERKERARKYREKMKKEEVDQIDEISGEKVKSYLRATARTAKSPADSEKRKRGAAMAVRRLETEEVEQTDEALKGNQHKIDANKNGKIDGHDFKILRNAKKARYQ